MARQRNKNRRVLGPYPKRDGFQIVHVTEDGEREHFVYSTKEAADEAISALIDEINRPKKTIRDALKDYETYMRDDKGNKENSIDQTGRKLRRFFDDLDVALTDLTSAKCEALYTAMRTSKRKPQKRNRSPMERFRLRRRSRSRSRSTTTATRSRRPRRSSAGA